MGEAGDIALSCGVQTGLNHAMLSAPKIRDTRLQFSGGAHRRRKAQRMKGGEERTVCGIETGKGVEGGKVKMK